MKLRSILLALLGLLAAAVAHAQPPPTLKPDELRPGMKGHGLTVVKGTQVERFDVEILGVLRNALPKQDMILIRCTGLEFARYGVVAGMSGSPIFVTDDKGQDRLVGALSYGFPYNKDPVAGVTPIGDMWPEFDRKLVPPPRNQKLEPLKLASVPMPDGQSLQPVAVPLVFSGIHPDVLEAQRKDWQELGFSSMQLATGGAGKAKAATSGTAPKFEPGSAISLVLAKGDISITGIGTVTWVQGDRFIAFGHPFKSLGQVHLPVGGADIQWVLASQASSFKMGVALEDFGVLDQDRQAAVAGRTGVRAAMVPMTVRVTNSDRKQTDSWHVEVTDQPLFFPLATAAVIGNAVRSSEPIAEDVAVRMKLRFELDGGHAPIVLEDTFTGLSGMQGVNEVGSVAGNLAKALVYNGFERLRVAKVEAEFTVAEQRNIVFMEGLRVASEEVEAGVPVLIQVQFMLANAGPRTVTVTLPPLPRELAGSTVNVQVGAERGLARESPEPGDIDDLLNALRRQPSNSRLVAVVQLPEPTVMLRGHRLVDLPLGARDEIAGHTVQVRAGKQTLRGSVELPWTINGSGNLKLRVRAAP